MSAMSDSPDLARSRQISPDLARSRQISPYLEDALTAWIAGTTFPTPPANWYVALFTTATDDAAGGTEVTGGSYARKAVAATGAQWTRGTSGPGTITPAEPPGIALAEITIPWPRTPLPQAA